MQAGSNPGRRRTPRTALWLVFGALLYGALEAGSLAGLHLLENRLGIGYSADSGFELEEAQHNAIRHALAGKTEYSAFSPTLGWTIRPGGNSALYRANGQGLRADRDYAPAPPAGILRVAAFGDSYTHGTDVGNAHTWQAALERLDPRMEVLNFGVGAYGLDQAYLRYLEDGRRFEPRVVLIGLMSENINRSVSVFRPFYVANTGAPLAKPRFVLNGDGLALLPNPLRSAADYERLLADPQEILPMLGKHDYFYQTRHRPRTADFLPSVRLAYLLVDHLRDVGPLTGRDPHRYYNTRSEAFEVTARVAERFYRDVEADGGWPVIVMFPHIGALRQYMRQGTKRYQPMLDRFDKSGMRYVDTLEGFVELQEWKGKRKMWVPGFAHYSAVGNEMVARTLLRHFEAEDLFSLVDAGEGSPPANPPPGAG